MATIGELRGRSERLFTRLLTAQARAPRATARGVAGRAPRPPFSWFDSQDALAANALALRLSALTASRPRVNDGLTAALDHAEREARRRHPELVRQGLALFVTHNTDGRRLAKPRAVSVAPSLFQSRPRATRRRGVSIGGAAPQLDYWREDALANEHHMHWHEVYPWVGLIPKDFRAWIRQTAKSDQAAILNAMSPRPDWPQAVAAASPTQLAGWFAQVIQMEGVQALPPALYRKLYTLNDRQGELFFYMHKQMLARYDAELLSHGLPRVSAYGPAAWSEPIPEGQDPQGIPGFARRNANRTMAAGDVTALRAMQTDIMDDLTQNHLRGPSGAALAITRTRLGEAVEATIPQLRDGLDPATYGGLHNSGHVAIATLATGGPGVMISTRTAIRDQVFWRWHKNIDDLNARWQDTQPPEAFTDKPNVVIRNDLTGANNAPWASPDIILCRTPDLPAGADPTILGTQLFGGASWSKDFSSTTATAGTVSLTTVSELRTAMSANALTHTPFSYFLRIQNGAKKKLDVTVRIFLAPAPQAEDRRMWIEMDKFPLTLASQAKAVVYRPDTEAAVIKRPAETSLSSVGGGGSGPQEDTYCDCGWPYSLLLPRGDAHGMEFRMLVACTDATVDQIGRGGDCGSMSYCGAVDRYPDSRDMGYPFARPFSGPAANAVRETVVAQPHMAARTITIRHG
jgi:hypothetical protein